MIFRSQICLSLFAAMALMSGPANAVELSQESVKPLFKDYRESCFELLDCQTGKVFRYNPDVCSKRFSPLSTFKIFNSLAGLESGVLKDANHFMKWDGQKHQLETWNRDQTLASAMRDSVVWYYQKVAVEVGEKRMKEYIQAVHYGNEDISGGITKFWLGDTLQISPDEQVDFVKRLCSDSLPFSKRSMTIVKEIMELKKTAKGDLHGKTGTDGKDNKNFMGWFVGYVIHDGKPYVFATIIEADGAYGRKARKITEHILQDAGLL